MTQPKIVLFTRDLRVHDHPALDAAVREGPVVPLFVLDDRILRAYGAPNRVRFLIDSLRDLRSSLRRAGGDLWVGRGDTAREVTRIARDLGATDVYLSGDASRVARSRVRALERRGLRVKVFDGISVVSPGVLVPGVGDHYKLFTPYLRAWTSFRKRGPLDAPARVEVPDTGDRGGIPDPGDLLSGRAAPELLPGGESAARARAARWLSEGVHAYAASRDDLGADATSRLSPYLHFGCISPLELVAEAPSSVGGREFVRQLCWRDFFLQVLAATPGYPRADYKARGDGPPVHDPDLVARWEQGTTGVPLVDAGMRQLLREGWMHNRARLVTASFLTRRLGLDWRLGAAHFWKHLVDGDLASNAGNWQWVAGTGNATRRGSPLSPVRQARRHDPDGAYVRRYVDELSELPAGVIHEPWKLGPRELDALGYPMPVTGEGLAQPVQQALVV